MTVFATFQDLATYDLIHIVSRNHTSTEEDIVTQPLEDCQFYLTETVCKTPEGKTKPLYTLYALTNDFFGRLTTYSDPDMRKNPADSEKLYLPVSTKQAKTFFEQRDSSATVELPLVLSPTDLSCLFNLSGPSLTIPTRQFKTFDENVTIIESVPWSSAIRIALNMAVFSPLMGALLGAIGRFSMENPTTLPMQAGALLATTLTNCYYLLSKDTIKKLGSEKYKMAIEPTAFFCSLLVFTGFISSDFMHTDKGMSPDIILALTSTLWFILRRAGLYYAKTHSERTTERRSFDTALTLPHGDSGARGADIENHPHND